MKKLLYFPDYSVTLDCTEYRKKSMAKKLKEEILKVKSSSQSNVASGDGGGDDPISSMNVQLVYFTKFPQLNEHEGHLMKERTILSSM